VKVFATLKRLRVNLKENSYDQFALVVVWYYTDGAYAQCCSVIPTGAMYIGLNISYRNVLSVN